MRSARVCSICTRKLVHRARSSACCEGCQNRARRTRIRSMVSGAKIRAKKKGWDFDLTIAWALARLSRSEWKCEATGIPLSVVPRKLESMSFDRINGKRGYTRDNVRITCWAFNQMKGPMSDFQLQKVCRAYLNRLDGVDDE